MSRPVAALVLLLCVCMTAVAQPAPSSDIRTSVGQVFWDGVRRLGVVFRSIGSLGGGARRGEIWLVTASTLERRQVGSGADWSWPIMTNDNMFVYAMRGGQVRRISGDGTDIVVSDGPAWYKLLGVSPDGTVIGFLATQPWPHLATLTPGGDLQTAVPGEEERERVAYLLQEPRDYADGTRLEVRRSERGGRGYDVFLLSDGRSRNLSDCGDDSCGQPSLTPDGKHVLFIRQR